MKKAPTLAEASPVQVRRPGTGRPCACAFRLACRQYAERVEMEKIAQVHERVVSAGTDRRREGKDGALARSGRCVTCQLRHGLDRDANDGSRRKLSQVHDLRDMLTLLRTMQIKPQDGRRKDLKKDRDGDQRSGAADGGVGVRLKPKAAGIETVAVRRRWKGFSHP